MTNPGHAPPVTGGEGRRRLPWPAGFAGELILHWNGTRWRRVPAPAYSELQSVAVTSARDAWAVGDTAAGELILHWNGNSWTRTPGPRIPGAILLSVTASSAASAWAVGYAGGSVILHWNGATWKQVPSPRSAGASLFSVTAPSSRTAFDLTAFWSGRAHINR